MKKQTTLSLVAAVLAVASAPGVAQTAPAAAASSWTFTGNAGLFTDYRFRGVSQTNEKPAFQGGIDIAHSSGLYAGNWNSNIDSPFFNGSNLEMDFYGGYKGAFDAFSYDVGAIYYYYPGSDPKYNNAEIYLGGGWGPVSLKYYYAVSDYFNAPNSDGTWYLDAAVSWPLSGGWTLVGHLGYTGLTGGAKVVEIGSTAAKDSITDWKLGVTYDLSGWLLGASYIGTNRDLTGGTAAAKNSNISGDTLVLSVVKSF
jgi:uncharacterized protein (TIGR02001 family)